MRPEAKNEARPLPALRGELKFVSLDGRSRAKGNALIVDPLARRYIAVDDSTHTLLALWAGCKSGADLIERAWTAHSLMIGEEDVAALEKFLAQNRLLAEHPNGWRDIAGNDSRARPSWFEWLIHNYLFIRLPLVRPQKFLQDTLWLVEPLYSRTFAAIVTIFGFFGVYLVSRQWDQFVTTFSNFVSLEGFLILAAALVFVKSLHELGHAYTAVRFGCRVPAMGVCFMVLVPMLYTDVTDVWTLGARRKRLAVDGAGIVVELILACFATCLWAFLPDGPARAAVFAIATTGWVMSLVLNLNPFMRFDGYYLFADFLDIENLQPRSFELGRWRLRELLFGLGAPPPERFPPRVERLLVIYAYMTWIYRFVLFAGIAVLVYVMTFKILGLVLFLIEIIYFIAWPMWAELKEWYGMRDKILKSRRTIGLAFGLGGLVLAATLPWRTSVEIPATIEPPQVRDVFPFRGGEIVHVSAAAGLQVEMGQTLLVLRSRELEQSIEHASRKLEIVSLRLSRRLADGRDREDSLVLEDEQRALQTKLAGFEREKSELEVKAPMSGVLSEVNSGLHNGRVISRGELIAVMAAGNGAIVRGYVREDDLKRIARNARGVFVPDSILGETVDVSVLDIALSASDNLPEGELTSTYGGAISVRQTQGQGRSPDLVPTRAHYLVTAEAGFAGQLRVVRRMRGTLLINGEPESMAVRAARQLFSVLIRESGF